MSWWIWLQTFHACVQECNLIERSSTLQSLHSCINEAALLSSLCRPCRPLMDLRVSVTGGVHFDLVKRVLRDIKRSGQAPEEIIQQVHSKLCYPAATPASHRVLSNWRWDTS